MDAELSLGQVLPEPQKGETLTDQNALIRAIQEAYKGAGFVSPNPLVGCVILSSENKFLAKGHHALYGGPHAEVNALAKLTNDELTGAKVFVTLEPCAHQGQTPSCAKTLAQFKIKEVIYGLIDPNPLVAGQGLEILKNAGIAVRPYTKLFRGHELQKIEVALHEVCEHFLKNFTQKKIFVSLKVAASLDGKIALSNGESKWITGPRARAYAHYLRATHDATLVGRGTIESDDPELNIRLDEATADLYKRMAPKKNKIVILDGDAKTLKSSYKIFSTHKAEDLFFCISEKNKSLVDSEINPKCTLLIIKEKEGAFDLSDLLKKLWDKGVRSLLVEGGGRTISHFIESQLFDRLYLFQAPIIIGQGRSWTDEFQIQSMKDKLLLQNGKNTDLGPDLLLTYTSPKS